MLRMNQWSGGTCETGLGNSACPLAMNCTGHSPLPSRTPPTAACPPPPGYAAIRTNGSGIAPIKPLRCLAFSKAHRATAKICRSASVRRSRKQRYNHAQMLGGDVQASVPLAVAADSGGAVAALTASPQAWMCLPGRSDVRIRIQGTDRRVVVTLPVRPAASRSIGDPAAALMDRLDGPRPQERGGGPAGLLALARNPGNAQLLVWPR
jgi:hypothetical protein